MDPLPDDPVLAAADALARATDTLLRNCVIPTAGDHRFQAAVSQARGALAAYRAAIDAAEEPDPALHESTTAYAIKLARGCSDEEAHERARAAITSGVELPAEPKQEKP